MAGETALSKFWKRKVRLDIAIKTIQHEASITMRTFDSKIQDFYQQFDSIEKRLIRIEELVDEHRERVSIGIAP